MNNSCKIIEFRSKLKSLARVFISQFVLLPKQYLFLSSSVGEEITDVEEILEFIYTSTVFFSCASDPLLHLFFDKTKNFNNLASCIYFKLIVVEYLFFKLKFVWAFTIVISEKVTLSV